MIGRRVESLDDLERPGDYVPFLTDANVVKCLWFILPEGTQGRIAAKGYGQPSTFSGETEPEWTITVATDGAVTVDPSIDYPGHWHGHLQGGVWTP